MKSDCTALVERLENFEKRSGLLLNAIYAEFSEVDGQIDMSVRGEAHASSGETLSHDMEIVASAYDIEGRLIGTASSWINSESFFGFDTFDLSLYDLSQKPTRIRVFPKLS